MPVYGVYSHASRGAATLVEHLKDLRDRDALEDPDASMSLVVAVPAKGLFPHTTGKSAKPKSCVQAALDWAVKEDIPYEIITIDENILSGYEESAKRVYLQKRADGVHRKMCSLMKSGEGTLIVAYQASAEDELTAEGDLDSERMAGEALTVNIPCLSGNDVDLSSIALEDPDEADITTEPQEETVTTAKTKKQTLGAAADAGDEESIELLTSMAEAAGIDPDEYPTWTELDDALDAAAEPEPEPEPEAEADEVDELTALGNEADAGDENAQIALAERAATLGIDPEEIATWAEVAEQIAAAEGQDEPEPEDEEPYTVNGTPVTLHGLGTIADTGSEDDAAEAADQLTSLAEDAGFDPDDYATWAALAEALSAAESPEEPEDDEEPAEPASKPSGRKKPGAMTIRETAAALDDDPDHDDAQKWADTMVEYAKDNSIDHEAYRTWVEIVDAVEERQAPLGHTAADLEGLQLRELRSLALAEGWSGDGLSREAIIARLLGGEVSNEDETVAAIANAINARLDGLFEELRSVG